MCHVGCLFPLTRLLHRLLFFCNCLRLFLSSVLFSLLFLLHFLCCLFGFLFPFFLFGRLLFLLSCYFCSLLLTLLLLLSCYLCCLVFPFILLFCYFCSRLLLCLSCFLRVPFLFSHLLFWLLLYGRFCSLFSPFLLLCALLFRFLLFSRCLLLLLLFCHSCSLLFFLYCIHLPLFLFRLLHFFLCSLLPHRCAFHFFQLLLHFFTLG
mmetsp:Transcript_43402/g.109598  ORF Transcript_43402/g.109598 Transcript_43402/m.109598 type:complete len:207 (+) Transcript_43402:578-1198(+)